jgi:hypothetical protein
MSAHVLTRGRPSVLAIARKLSKEQRTPYLDRLRATIIADRERHGQDVTFELTQDALDFPRRTGEAP